MSASWDKLMEELAALKTRLDNVERAVVYPALSRKTDQDLARGLGDLGDEWESYPLGHFDALGSAAARAPADAQYVVGAAHADLSAERVGTSSNSITWDFTVAGQALVKRAALTGVIEAAADTNTTTFGASARGAAIANADGTLADATAKINAILDRMRADTPVIAT